MDSKTVLGFFPALNKVSDDFISLIKSRRKGNNIHGFEELAYTMGLESKKEIYFFFLLFKFCKVNK